MQSSAKLKFELLFFLSQLAIVHTKHQRLRLRERKKVSCIFLTKSQLLSKIQSRLDNGFVEPEDSGGPNFRNILKFFLKRKHFIESFKIEQTTRLTFLWISAGGGRTQKCFFQKKNCYTLLLQQIFAAKNELSLLQCLKLGILLKLGGLSGPWYCASNDHFCVINTTIRQS